MTSRPKVVAFDVIETLFSLDAVKDRFEAVGLSSPALDLWFAAGLRDAFALAASEAYAPFRDVLASALDELSVSVGQPISEEQKEEILEAIRSMTPHADVEPALGLLGRAGIRVIALSNGSTAIATRLIESAGFEATFERVLSTDGVGHSKPHPDVYRHAADSVGIQPGEMMLIAAHPWDVHGAKAAGLLAGYVNRGRPYPRFMHTPDFSEQSLDRLVELVLVA